MPKVSLVIPVYNVEKLLKRCLDSVLGQTFADFEVICVNDGSPDNSLEILEQYSNSDKRIKVITQENKGLSGARNTGIENADGEYICFLDSDDIIHPQYLEILLENAAENIISKCSFADFSYDKDLNFNKIENIQGCLHNAFAFYSSVEDIDLSACGKMYHKDIIAKYRFNEQCFFSEDVLFHTDALADNIEVNEIDSKLYFYFENPESLVHAKSTLKKVMSLLLVAETISTKYKNNKDVYKYRTSKALSNAIKSLDTVEEDKTKAYNKIKDLKNGNLISYKHLSLKKKLKLFNILNFK
jgi:glycosyltransferase involved in cell wall biosynthesis